MRRDAARALATARNSAADLERIAERAAEIALGLLVARIAGAPATYTTRQSGPRPAEYADRLRAWRGLAPGIPGAVRLGRWWSVSREAYERWLAAKAEPARTAPVSPSANDAPWSPASVACDLGLRLDQGASPERGQG